MARASQNATYGYSLADAQHVLKAAGKHWPALQSLGATEAERKRFTQTIAEAGRYAGFGGAFSVIHCRREQRST